MVLLIFPHKSIASALYHICCGSLKSVQFVNISLVLGSSGLHAGFWHCLVNALHRKRLASLLFWWWEVPGHTALKACKLFCSNFILSISTQFFIYPSLQALAFHKYFSCTDTPHSKFVMLRHVLDIFAFILFSWEGLYFLRGCLTSLCATVCLPSHQVLHPVPFVWSVPIIRVINNKVK